MVTDLDLYDLQGTLQGRIVELLLEILGPRVEPWEAEEMAEKIIAEILGE